MEIREIIRAGRQKRGLSQAKLAKLIGDNYTQTSISEIESGRKNPSVPVLEKIFEILAIKLDDTAKVGIKIPVLGSIPAGIALEAIEDIVGWEEIPLEMMDGGREYFGLVVQGDSMYPDYMEGDTVIIRKQPTCDSGDDCAVILDGERATLKRVYIHIDHIELEATNRMYGKRSYTNAEVQSLPVNILGVVVELRRKKK